MRSGNPGGIQPCPCYKPMTKEKAPCHPRRGAFIQATVALEAETEADRRIEVIGVVDKAVRQASLPARVHATRVDVEALGEAIVGGEGIHLLIAAAGTRRD